MWEGVAQGLSDNQFGGRRGALGGAQPTTKTTPDRGMMVDCQILKQTLDDETDLNVTLIGRDFASDLGPVEFTLAMEVLVTVSSADGRHVAHPEVIGIGSDGVDSGFETDLDFEAPSIKANDRHGVQRNVGTQEDHSAAGGMVDQHQTD